MQKFLCRQVVTVLFVSGCATSFAPPETATSLTKGPQAIAIVDTDNVRLQQLFIRGLTRALVDDHKQAIFLFEQAIQLDARQPAIQTALAESHAALNELDAAIYYATQAVRLDPTNRPYTILLGELLHRAGSNEESLSVLKDWIAKHPDDVDTHFKTADLLAELGRQQEALDIYLNLLKGQGDEMPIRYRMLQLYNGLGDLEGMRNTAKRMLAIDPTDNSLRRLLAEVYVEMDSTGAAIGVLHEAVTDDPTDMGATLLLSKLYREVGRDTDAEALVHSLSESSPGRPADRMTLASDLYARSASDVLAAQRAEELLGQMLEEGIKTPDVLFMLGDLRYRSAEYLPAAPLLLQAAEAEPRRVDAWSRAALSYLKGGAFDRALAVAEEALVLFPGQYALLRVAGQASLRESNPEQAIKYSAYALEVFDQDPDASQDETVEMYLLQASAYRELGLPESAEKALRKALGISPENAQANYWLVFSLLDQDSRHEEARRIAKRCHERDPGNPMFLDAMGWIEHVAGNNPLALDWLNRAIAIDEKDPRSQEHLGDVYSALDNTEAARVHWQKALKLEPGRVALKAKIDQHP